MRAQGFVFSLDAFVAFVLIMITINFLIFTIGTPKPYYAELEAAHILAYDTLQVLATSGDTPVDTYLERILKGDGSTGDIMGRVAGGKEGKPIIPKGYGYRLEYLNFSGTPPDEWTPLYDAGTDPNSDRYGKNYTKLQASATTFLSVYLFQPMQGESPFCHAGCRGYGINNETGEVEYAEQCDATPCNITTSNFRVGTNRIMLVRLTVYT